MPASSLQHLRQRVLQLSKLFFHLIRNMGTYSTDEMASAIAEAACPSLYGITRESALSGS